MSNNNRYFVEKIKCYFFQPIQLLPWILAILYGDKDGAKIEDANGEFGFPSNGHELQKSPSSATGILTLSYTSGVSERKISTSSSLGASSYLSNLANTTTTTIADDTVSMILE